MEFRIHHVAVSVSDMEKAVEFYSILGFKEIACYKDDNLEIKHLYLNGFILELFCFKEHIGKELVELWEDLKRIGVKHFALSVPDIHKAKKHLLDKGIIQEDIEIKKGRTGILYFFIQDPDGNFVEIVEDRKEY
ncbi:VOC family protein [Hydrogenivirga sp. 128-5-R1-1]|uniref:VOC family protein n=1 Tax=Hydrogenivirga sp. 128-5-R1-1 TaxID=392423 RepID=UPI00015F2C1B|nr:VOC family protein [Hydrogenivirga sp. 128-5-R1-1]EDP73222.1 glyoxylase family protein [Hydrogenivirga sp. 128-5-R1-1]